jgi:exodeoxyribonuclease VII large subunit
MPSGDISHPDFQLSSMGGPQVFSVSELTWVIRTAIEQGLPNEIWIEGEVSNLRKQSSGHQYFTLKDSTAQLSCVLFARPGLWRRPFNLADGMQVRTRGRITVYEARGQYQLNVQHVEAAGAGLLQARFEALKRKLDAEGLFDPDRKRPIPRFPSTVAIITSPSGAALRDMLNIIARRAPWLRVIVSPARVQGEGAASEILAALNELNATDRNGLPRPDVIVLARGGGSVEDLLEFNDESLARSVAASPIPVISAVGHEIDFSICDFAADLRAPTPSAAAEIVAPDGADLIRRLALLSARIERETRQQIDTALQRADLTAESLTRTARERLVSLRAWLTEKSASLREHRPDQVIRLRRHSLTSLASSLTQSFQHTFARRKERLQRIANHLRLLSPESTLQRGYTITTADSGTIIIAADAVSPGQRLTTRTAKGEIVSRVE